MYSMLFFVSEIHSAKCFMISLRLILQVKRVNTYQETHISVTFGSVYVRLHNITTDNIKLENCT